MKRVILPILAAAALLPALALAQELPPGPEVPHKDTFEDAHRFSVVQLVLDFAPGSWTPSHSHGGLGFVTVIEGEMTVREEGEERVYATGDTWREHPGHYAEVGNDGDVPARVLATFLIPEGGKLTVAGTTEEGADLPPGPTVARRGDLEGRPAPSEFDVVQLWMEFPAGSWTPVHSHGGHAYVTVVGGEMTVRPEGGSEQTYGPGDTWIENPGEFAEVGNDGDSDAQIAVTFLLPKGESLTTQR